MKVLINDERLQIALAKNDRRMYRCSLTKHMYRGDRCMFCTHVKEYVRVS